jgi:hypothetical protein
MTASRSCKSQAVSRAASLVIVELQHFERYATRAGPTSAFGSSEGVGRVTSAVALSCLSVNRQRTQRFNHRSVSVISPKNCQGFYTCSFQLRIELTYVCSSSGAGSAGPGHNALCSLISLKNQS